MIFPSSPKLAWSGLIKIDARRIRLNSACRCKLKQALFSDNDWLTISRNHSLFYLTSTVIAQPNMYVIRQHDAIETHGPRTSFIIAHCQLHNSVFATFSLHYTVSPLTAL